MAANAKKMRAALEAMADDGDQLGLGTIHPATGRRILSPKRTLPTAKLYVSEFHQHADGRTLHAHHSTLLDWRGNRYVEIEDATVKHRLHPWLHAALQPQVDRKSGAVQLVDFGANPTTVNHALESIKTHVHLPEEIVSPSWLDGRTDPPAHELIPCRTCTLHIPTGRVLPATPALFTVNALEFDYDPLAAPPQRWFQLMWELFGEDLESIALLQEWFGYCLTGDTSLQKALLMVGPKRSGKGTVGRLLTRLVGPGNVTNPTTNSLAGTFGLQPLIGKSLAIISDARFVGDSTPIVVERLLNITGEDALTIDRKFLPSVTTKLPTRFMVLTNELPRFHDASTALAGRFLVLRLTRSFYGIEDARLTGQLLEELPGILLWAIEGWRRLQERERFHQPSSAAEAIRDLEDLASPVGAFIRDCCTVSAGQRVNVADLYAAWRAWCDREGRTSPGTRQRFGVDLSAAAPGVKRRRGTHAPHYEGIGLVETATDTKTEDA